MSHMYRNYNQNTYPYFANAPVYNYQTHSYRHNPSNHMLNKQVKSTHIGEDHGPEAYVVNISKITKQNTNYRVALWTGAYLQLTLTSINPGEDIGLEMHPDLDQFIRIEDGRGYLEMGMDKDNLDFQAEVYDDFAIFVPAGTWHNLTNGGDKPLKLYSIYAPPQHPRGIIHETKEDAEAAERE